MCKSQMVHCTLDPIDLKILHFFDVDHCKKAFMSNHLAGGSSGTGVRRKMMLSSDDVRAAYRLILGREPENDSVVLAHAEQVETLEELRKKFFDSPEFRPPVSRAQPLLPLNWPPMDIELDATPEQLQAMRNHIEENWRQLGISDPHWSVMTHELFRAANIEQNKEAFYESGRSFVFGQFSTTLKRCGLGSRGSPV